MPSAASTTTSNLPTPPARRKASWWRSPQRVWLRRAIFQIHLWLGILLALYSVVIGISGSMIVFHDELEHAIYGQQLALQVVPRTLSLQDAVSKIVSDRPGWLAIGLRYAQSTDHPAQLLMRPVNDPAATNVRYVTFNQFNGHVQQDRLRFSDWLGWVTNLHFFLLAGRLGLKVSAWMALGLALLCFSGVVVWWPGVSRWAAALILRKRGSWKRFNWDMHSVVGFWSSLALGSVALTGVYFGFPLVVGALIVKSTGGDLKQAIRIVVPPKAQPFRPGTPALPLDDALYRLNTALQPAPPAEYVQLPTNSHEVFGGLSYFPGTLQYTEFRRAAVDPHSGVVLMTADTHQMQFGMHALQYIHAIHFGTFGGNGWFGIVVRCVWVVLGLTPALLAVTGLLMYWNRKLGPLLQRSRLNKAGL